MSALPAIDTQGLCRRYGRRWALTDVTLQVPAGCVAMVTGRNGSGKSTLLRVLASAIRPHRGTARVAGFDVAEQPWEVRRRVALLAHASYLYEPLSALENLQVSARFLGPEAAREDALRARLHEVGLGDRASDAVGTFSAGMRRRLALARALLQPAEVVLLDEPYAQLDPPGFALVDTVVERLRAAGATVVMATHLLERSRSRADLAVVLEAGRLQWVGPPAELDAGVAS